MRSVNESAVTEQLHNKSNSEEEEEVIWFPLTTLRPIGTATWSRGPIQLCLHGLGGPQSR